MNKFFIIFALILIIFGGIWAGTHSSAFIKNNQKELGILTSQIPTKTISTVPTYSANPTIVRPAIPQHLQIPAIQVDASVEQVGLDAQGRMDVPSTADNVAWFAMGFRPGEKGNAAIDGHLDRVSGAPAVFWNLSKLQSGDRIIVTDANGKNYTFSVTRTVSYPYNQFPLQEVFGPSSQSMLNLITCQGTWDAVNKNYSNRSVVYSQLVQ